MGKDSEYYKNKTSEQRAKLRELRLLLPEFAKQFLDDKHINAQPSTLIQYSYDILSFLDYLKQYGVSSFKDKATKDFDYDDIKNLTPQDIIEYEHYLEYNPASKGTKRENGKHGVARRLSALRGMFKYNYEHGNIDKNPMELVKMPKIKKDKNIVRLNPEEIINILNEVEYATGNSSKHSVNYRKKTQLRDLALMTLMLGTGIRVSECAGLDLKDVNFTENSLTIVRKGGGQDIIYFGDEVEKALKDYIESDERKNAELKADDFNKAALFYSMQNKRISVDAIENLVKKFAKIAVPDKKITPHKLRSTYGTALYRKTGDIRLVADVLGHESVNTTARYYAAMEDEHKRKAKDAVSLRDEDDNKV